MTTALIFTLSNAIDLLRAFAEGYLVPCLLSIQILTGLQSIIHSCFMSFNNLMQYILHTYVPNK